MCQVYIWVVFHSQNTANNEGELVTAHLVAGFLLTYTLENEHEQLEPKVMEVVMAGQPTPP